MTAFTDLLASAESEKHFLVRLDFWDITDEVIVSEYFSTHGFVSEPADTPANQYYDARLARPLDYQRRLSLADFLAGVAFPEAGTIKLNNNDGGLDHFADYASSGRRVRIWLGGVDFALSDFGLIADATADGHDFDDEFITINIRNPQFVFDKEIQSSRYAGSGGAEGNSDVANQLKVRTYGVCRNVPLKYLGLSGGGLHQLAASDGAIIGILKLRNYGLPSSDAAGLQFTSSATPGAAEWTYDCSNGIITLGGAYEGPFGADVIGKRYLSATSTTSNTVGTGSKTWTVTAGLALPVGAAVRVGRTAALHSTWMDGTITTYSGTSLTINCTSSLGSGTHTDWTISPWGTAAGIIKDIATTFGVTSFDTATFTALDTAQPASVGWHLPAGGNGLQIVGDIAKGAGVFAGFDRAGQFEVGRVAAPSSPSESYTVSQVIDGSFDRVELDPPPYQFVVRYQKNWSVLSSSDIVGAVSEADRTFLLNEWRLSTPVTDNDILTAFPQSQAIEYDSIFDSSSVAAAEATRLAGLFGVVRNYFNMKFKVQPLARDLNQTVNLTYPRHGLNAGENLLLVDIGEDMEKLEVSTGLWG